MSPKMAQDHIPIYLTSPNQKAIVTHKAESDKENLYGILTLKLQAQQHEAYQTERSNFGQE